MSEPALEGLPGDFEEFIIALADAAADFLIVGAYAMGLHGVPRATQDIGIWVRPDVDNARRVWAALEAFGAPLVATGLTLQDLEVPGTNYQIGVAPIRIDLLTEVSGVEFADAWATRASLTFKGRTVHFIGREALARNKRASGRAKDLLDLEILEKQR